MLPDRCQNTAAVCPGGTGRGCGGCGGCGLASRRLRHMIRLVIADYASSESDICAEKTENFRNVYCLFLLDPIYMFS